MTGQGGEIVAQRAQALLPLHDAINDFYPRTIMFTGLRRRIRGNGAERGRVVGVFNTAREGF